MFDVEFENRDQFQVGFFNGDSDFHIPESSELMLRGIFDYFSMSWRWCVSKMRVLESNFSRKLDRRQAQEASQASNSSQATASTCPEYREDSVGSQFSKFSTTLLEQLSGVARAWCSGDFQQFRKLRNRSTFERDHNARRRTG